jgi:hypothetical protein
VSALFTEVRLVRCQMTLSPRAPYLVTIEQGRIKVGTNMLFNSTTFTTPTSWADVQNLSGGRFFSSTDTRVRTVEMIVPRELEYANMAADAPATVTPWAGSPGCFVVYGDAFATVATNYFQISFTAIWQMRGRQ